jgi:hypothetical protein
MERLTAKLFHQFTTTMENNEKVFAAGGSCHVIKSTNIRVIRMGGSHKGECRRIVLTGKHYTSGNAKWVGT